jgi:hypothetical protein
MFPIEDGHAQERTALDEVIQTVEARDLWVADRNFCTHKLMYELAGRNAAFVIRHHKNVVGTVSARRLVGETERGRIYECTMRLEAYHGKTLTLRRIEIELFEPTRDGETSVALLTNLPVDAADALKGSEIYLGRWQIETAFQTLTTTLRCEVSTLCYPRAALFAFATAVLAYNAITVLETAIRAEHGTEVADQLSKYYMATEIAETNDGISVVLEDSDFDIYRDMPITEFCQALRDVAQHIDINYYRKTTRGPKKRVKKVLHNKKQNVSNVCMRKGLPCLLRSRRRSLVPCGLPRLPKKTRRAFACESCRHDASAAGARVRMRSILCVGQPSFRCRDTRRGLRQSPPRRSACRIRPCCVRRPATARIP